ncbi:hypothetical protein QTP86_022017 [Hemibagrus guttatus]|nr:hypothetical protein QTP86_022017 [Hemibagrus guttatus]
MGVTVSNTITTCSNQKPCMTAEVRAHLKSRDSAFRAGDKAALRTERAKLSRAIREAKRTHAQRIHGHFQDSGDSRHMWQGIQAITNYKTTPSACDSDASLPEALNDFYGRFEAHINVAVRKTIPPPNDQVLCLSTADVRRTLCRVNPRKSAGPDNIPGRVLRECAEQLADVFTDLFNISLTSAVVPTCLKTTTIVPVPKKQCVAITESVSSDCHVGTELDDEPSVSASCRVVQLPEQPIFSTRAHVFQIDPNTKKNWVPTSKHAVTVSYFYDSTRNVYRIISLDGSKAIINSTITPNMTFTKTSQKFGQWADSRANTVYGLGFSSESNLSKFAEKFAEFKEAARLAKEKSQEKMELTSTPSQRKLALASSKESATGDLQSPLTPESINGTDDEQIPPDPSQNPEPRAETNAVPFPHSTSTNMTKHWEAELAALKSNNAKLTAALLESTANVKQWKQQLAAYQEEAERLHKRVTELECVSGQTTGIKNQKTELNQTIEELEAALKAKEEELERLKAEVEKANELQSQKDTATQKLQETETRTAELEAQLGELEKRVESSQTEQETFRKNLRSLLELLDGKIFELTELRDNLAKLIDGGSS